MKAKNSQFILQKILQRNKTLEYELIKMDNLLLTENGN
jgi:hypothetical protein